MSAVTEGTSDRELVITRQLEAPPGLVFDAWTDPAQLPRWWGPHGMTTPVCEIDLKVGGLFRTLMRDPSGKEYPNSGVYLEVRRGERLVFTDAYEPGWMPAGEPFMTVVVTFEAAEGGTRLTARARHWTVEARERHEAMGFHGGWGQMMERLEAHLAAGRG